jgi:putative peptidoglycan lipid II flippase
MVMVKASSKQHKSWGGKTFRFSLGNFRLGRNFSVRRFSITEAAFLLLMAYIASKGLGVLRQSLFNSLFGTGTAATAYYAAFRLPDTIFNLIAGGALTHAFIPVLLSHEKEHGRMEVWRLSSLVFNILLLTLVISVFAGELFAPAFVNTILIPGLPPQQRALTTSLTRIMLLQPLILGLGTIFTAILHSKRQFFPSALAIAIYDLGPIGGLLLARLIPGIGIYGPAFGLLATALLQVAVQIPPLVKQGVRYTFTWNLRNPGLREVMRLLGPNILNVIVASAGAIVITYFASYLRDKTSIAVMHNAYAIFALPLTLVGQTIGNALLPQLTIQATHNRYARMRWTVLKIVGVAVLLGVVAAILLYAFGKPAIRILFQYGAFSAHATTLTSLALVGYAIGLPGQTASVLLALCFYAIKDVRTPLFANIFGLAVQIGSSLLLLKVLKGNDLILALPLAASTSGTAQGLLLGLLLYIRLTAKAKTDRGMQRLRERRKYASGLQRTGNNQQVAAVYSTPAPYQCQPIGEYQAVQPIQELQPEPSYASFIASQTTQPQVFFDPTEEEQPTQPSQPAIQRTQPEVFYEPEEEEQPAQLVVGHRSVTDYQRAVLLEPGNLKALVQWHIAMMTSASSERATILEVLTRICRQLRNEELSKYEIVTHAYNQAAIAHSDNADVYFALGQIHQQSGNYVMAIAAYKLAMSNSAIELMARFSIARCLLSLDRPQDAVQQLEDALQSLRRTSAVSIDPIMWAARPRAEGKEHLAPEVEISMLLAHAYRLIGRQEDTQAVLHQVKQIISYQDEMPITLTDFAAPQRGGNGHNAIPKNTTNVLNEVAQSVIQDPRPRDELVSLYMDQGLLNEAIIELRDLAIIYLRNNQLEQAGATMRRIGKIHAEVGDLEEALVFLHHAIEFIPNDINLLYEMVSLYYQLGRTQEAAYYQAEIAHGQIH